MWTCCLRHTYFVYLRFIVCLDSDSLSRFPLIIMLVCCVSLLVAVKKVQIPKIGWRRWITLSIDVENTSEGVQCCLENCDIDVGEDITDKRLCLYESLPRYRMEWSNFKMIPHNSFVTGLRYFFFGTKWILSISRKQKC